MLDLIYPAYPARVLPLPTVDSPGLSPRAGSEMLPVVEESGLVVGQTSRAYAHGGSRLLHPVVHLHIMNRFGDIYLQKRSMTKRLLPGRWDTAVGGHVDYGEAIDEALYRETWEELALRDFNPVHIKTYVWESKRERELVAVFATVGNFTPEPSNEEVEQGRYWTMEEIEAAEGKSILTPNFEQEIKSIKASLLALL